MKIFIDTNILVYCCDRREALKRKRCRRILRQITEGHVGVISTQVLQEFYVTAVKKLGMDPLATKDLVRSFGNFEVVTVSLALIDEAIDGSIINRLSFWDALIVVSAESAACAEIWSEDLNSGQVIRGVRVVNPIAA